jgi:outer membrane receptor for ferrienterochelin and colicins
MAYDRNCGVCNTGDIHINGWVQPYFGLIDGMYQSSLSTVYGLSIQIH